MPAVFDDISLSDDGDNGADQATSEVTVAEDNMAIYKQKGKAALLHCMMERE
jgi:hypothetical protein